MTQQKRFGLLRYHFSQQETVAVPSVTPWHEFTPSEPFPSNGRLIDSIAQKDTEHIHSIFPPDMGAIGPIVPQDRGWIEPIVQSNTAYINPNFPPMQQDNGPLETFPQFPQFLPFPAMDQELSAAVSAKRMWIVIIAAFVICLLFLFALYLIWQSSLASSPVVPSPIVHAASSDIVTPLTSSSNNPAPTNVASDSGGGLQVYIVGAVQHPGIYTLTAGERVYQLLSDAGGPLPNANLVGINLAAPLSDGQEIYVPIIGETPPAETISLSSSKSSSSSASSNSKSTKASSTSTKAKSTSTSPSTLPSGQLVNINTASETEMKQQLHVASKTAQAIISYRQQHGPYSSVSDLQNVVSKSIYNKIKNEVTV